MNPVITSNLLSEKSMLTAEMLVAWKRKRSVYNFNVLPEKAIIGIDKNIFSKHVHFFSKKLRGIRGVNYIHKHFVFCSGFGSGAPAIITLLEELRALGVKEFIFVGLAGSLTDTVKSGDAFYVSKTVSGSGTTSYYHDEDNIKPYDDKYALKLATELHLKSAVCFSTDSPFRETPTLIKTIKEKGCEFIEMECAAIYAFTQYYKLQAACFLIAADELHSNNWHPPSAEINLSERQIALVNRIIKSMI